MKKSILNLKGVQELTKNEQKSLNGGLKHVCKGGGLWCTNDSDCNPNGGTLGVCINQCCQIQ